MKCLPGKTTNPNCMNCGTRGVQFDYIYPMVYLRCLKCKHNWKTLAAICPKCSESNGTTEMSTCPKCSKRMAAG